MDSFLGVQLHFTIGRFIIKYDPNQTSFKNALIAIVFAANYLEAVFYIKGTEKIGGCDYTKYYDKGKGYRDKLELIGINDERLLAAASRQQETRKDIVHEKAKAIIEEEVLRIAQNEATVAVSLAKEVSQILQNKQS